MRFVKGLANYIKYVLNMKVKLENFYNFRVPELGKITRTLVCKGFGIFIIL